MTGPLADWINPHRGGLNGCLDERRGGIPAGKAAAAPLDGPHAMTDVGLVVALVGLGVVVVGVVGGAVAFVAGIGL